MVRKIMKISVLMCLLLAVLATSASAADTAYSRYNIFSNGYNWFEAPASYNTKASSGMPWYIRVEKLSFNGGNLQGGYGMGYCPLINQSQASANIHWAKAAHANNQSVNWGSGYGFVGVRYMLGARLDSVSTGITGAYTVGWWNAY